MYHIRIVADKVGRMIKSRRMRWAGHVARMGDTRNAYRILVGKSEGKRPLGRPRRKWVDNIKMDLGEIGWDGVDWIELAQDRDQWRALGEHGGEPSGSLKLLGIF
jgi:transcription termination factor 2